MTIPLRVVPIAAAFALVGILSAPTLAWADDPPPGGTMPAPGAAPMKPAMPAPGGAAGEAPNGGRFFDTYDANQDGRVTREEFGGEADVFELLDKDGDGAICFAELGVPADYTPRPLPKERDEPAAGMKGGEYRKAAEKRRAELAAMDKNGDKKVSKEEYTGKLPFEYLDRNKDGVIDEQDARGAGKGAGGAAGMATPEQLEGRFKEEDANGDGKVTKDEFPGPPERFTALDKDADGAISLEEFKAGMAGGGAGMGRRMLMKLDKDGDGKVSRAEFPGGDEKFKELDKNGDGQISDDEIPRPENAGKGPGKKPGALGGDAAPPPPPTTPGSPPAPTTPGSGATFDGLFTALDKDHDGRLSRGEFPGTDDEWRRLDRDANGWVTPDEARAR